ncbi:MAG: hypothetical protein OQL08_09870 [Gammaproteobacteria bacterium]|nr:hypothetical protein [Gammaproteobacteria bacterium]
MKNKSNLVILALLIISMANIFASYLAGHSFHSYLFNSDALYLPTLFSDLFSNGGNISDWYLTPAPYFFPDYILFFLAYLLGPSTYSQVAIFSIAQPVLTFFAIWFLVNQASKSGGFKCAATASIGLVWLALNYDELFSLSLSRAHHYNETFVFFLTSAHHYGIFLSSIVFVALWIRHENKKEKSIKSILFLTISILAFLSALSDNLFIVQTMLPFVATAILADIATRDFSVKKAFLALIPVFFGVSGSASYELFVENVTRHPVKIGVENAFHNLNDIYTIFHTGILKNPIYDVLFVIYLGVVIYSCYSLIKKSSARGAPRRLAWLALFSFLSFCSTLVAVILITDITVTTRYFIPLFSWPVIIVTLFLSHYFCRQFFIISITISVLAVISLSFGTTKLIRTTGLSDRYYPNKIACIDDALEEARVVNGIGQYWDAKYIKNFSKLNLNIAQYSENLGEMRWITSKKYFKQSYGFAIISEKAEPPYKISTEELLRINGTPERVVKCGDKSLYIYGKQKLRTRKIVNAGDFYQWKACELPSVIGKKASECEMQKKDVSQSGYVTFGPYEQLPSGRYAFEIAYSSAEKTKDTAGDWDVVLAIPNESEILKNGPLAGTDGTIVKIKGEFTLHANRNMEKIEIRTLAHQDMELKVSYIKVTRVE